MPKTPLPFSWKNRERDLANVLRFHEIPVMFYRTDDLIHSLRVRAIVKELLPYACAYYPQIDPELAITLPLFHDDPEIASKHGDVAGQRKLFMAIHEKEELELEEVRAAQLLHKCYRYRRIGRFRYIDLVMHALKKDCIEACLCSFADKLDGDCESIHEILAGNVAFLEPVMNYRENWFAPRKKKFKFLRKCFRKDNGYFSFPVTDRIKYTPGGISGGPHTELSIRSYSGIYHYEMWKRVTLTLPNGMERLTKQVEFIP